MFTAQCVADKTSSALQYHSVILVDAKGKIASEVAVGAPGVLKLATLKCKRKEKGGLP
jgi:hypothetical protein